MRSLPVLALLAGTVLASCGDDPSPLTGKWEGRRFGSDMWTLTLEDAHGRLSGTYRIQWSEEPSEVNGPLTGSSGLQVNPDFLDLLIEFEVGVEAGSAMCRYNATLRDDVVLSGETVCRLSDGTEFQVGQLGLRKS